MGCERCGTSTSRRYCRTCEMLIRTENDTVDGTAVFYECPECGEERSSGRDSECWLCRSDRYEEGDDGRPQLVTDGGDDDSDSAPRCEGCDALETDVPIRAIIVEDGGRERLCERCFKEALDEDRVSSRDPRVPGDNA